MKLLALALLCVPVRNGLNAPNLACTAPLIIPDTPPTISTPPSGTHWLQDNATFAPATSPCLNFGQLTVCSSVGFNALQSTAPQHHWTAQPDGNTLKLDGTEVYIVRRDGLIVPGPTRYFWSRFTTACSGHEYGSETLAMAKSIGEGCADEDAEFKPAR